MLVMTNTQNYTEGHRSFRIHTQRSACITLYGGSKINDLKGEYAIYYDAVYNNYLPEESSIRIIYKLKNALKPVFPRRRFCISH
jgi:hypothetical protein